DAPVIADHLCEPCRAHYDAVRENLTDLGVAWTEAPRLVRGLDYYTRTTFEFVHDGLGAQASVGGGGRYDGLSESIGGPPLPAIGFALGVDRTLLALESEGGPPPAYQTCDVYVVPLGEAAKRRALTLAAELRRAGVSTDLAYGERGLKGAMKAADRTGARYAVVVGDRDLDADAVAVKEMSTGEQQQVALDGLAAHLVERLTGRPA
ncbi:MAG: histidine--tRNA ligase, partial [Mycobacteriales bacterium]